MNITREHFTKLEPCDDEATLLGTLYVFGTPYHFIFVEVKDGDGILEAVNDPHNRLHDIQMVDTEAAFQPVEIDGKQYIGCATPFGN